MSINSSNIDNLLASDDPLEEFIIEACSINDPDSLSKFSINSIELAIYQQASWEVIKKLIDGANSRYVLTSRALMIYIANNYYTIWQGKDLDILRELCYKISDPNELVDTYSIPIRYGVFPMFSAHVVSPNAFCLQNNMNNKIIHIINKGSTIKNE